MQEREFLLAKKQIVKVVVVRLIPPMGNLSKYRLLVIIIMAETVVELQGESLQGGREHLGQAPRKLEIAQIHRAEEVVGEGRDVSHGDKRLKIKPFHNVAPVYVNPINASISPTLLLKQL
jgi:hypothetical protein